MLVHTKCSRKLTQMLMFLICLKIWALVISSTSRTSPYVLILKMLQLMVAQMLAYHQEIEDVVDHQIVLTREGYQKYLVKWRGRPLSNCTWITNGEFQYSNQDLYERFHVFNLSRSSFPKSGGVDGDKRKPPLKVYQRCKGVDSKARTLIQHSLNDNGLS